MSSNTAARKNVTTSNHLRATLLEGINYFFDRIRDLVGTITPTLDHEALPTGPGHMLDSGKFEPRVILKLGKKSGPGSLEEHLDFAQSHALRVIPVFYVPVDPVEEFGHRPSIRGGWPF